MEQTYKIIGIRSGNGYKKLDLIALENTLQQNEKVDPLDALKNFGGLVQKTSQMYMKQKQIDTIRVPDTVYVEKQLGIDGTFTITY